MPYKYTIWWQIQVVLNARWLPSLILIYFIENFSSNSQICFWYYWARALCLYKPYFDYSNFTWQTILATLITLYVLLCAMSGMLYVLLCWIFNKTLWNIWPEKTEFQSVEESHPRNYIFFLLLYVKPTSNPPWNEEACCTGSNEWNKNSYKLHTTHQKCRMRNTYFLPF